MPLPLPQPNIQALRELHRVVLDAPDYLFHMRSFIEETHCGTARCAIGWACMDPWFAPRFYPLVTVDYVSRTFLARFFGISMKELSHLIADDQTHSLNAHAISKAEVLWNICQLIRGKPSRPYRAMRGSGPWVPKRPGPTTIILPSL